MVGSFINTIFCVFWLSAAGGFVFLFLMVDESEKESLPQMKLPERAYLKDFLLGLAISPG